jgi:hypothetical protein
LVAVALDLEGAEDPHLHGRKAVVTRLKVRCNRRERW